MLSLGLTPWRSLGYVIVFTVPLYVMYYLVPCMCVITAHVDSSPVIMAKSDVVAPMLAQ